MISACLITYNRAAVLPRTLDQILAQEESDFELIICDNCSTDSTELVCRTYAKRDQRIRYHRNPRNVGFTGNMNVAVEQARRPYIAMLHDGELYSPRLFTAWKSALDTFPTAAFVFNAVGVQSSDGAVDTHFDHGYPPFVRGLDLYDDMLRTLSSPVWGIVMLRAEHVRQVGPFDETLTYPSDVDMWFRLLRVHDAAYVDERLYALYPKEADHPRSRINWTYTAEVARVYRSAADQRHPDRGRNWRHARGRVDRNVWRMFLFLLANAIRHRDWRAAAEGLRSLTGYR